MCLHYTKDEYRSISYCLKSLVSILTSYQTFLRPKYHQLFSRFFCLACLCILVHCAYLKVMQNIFLESITDAKIEMDQDLIKCEIVFDIFIQSASWFLHLATWSASWFYFHKMQQCNGLKPFWRNISNLVLSQDWIMIVRLFTV